jgi:hypothetical protein
MKYLSFVEKFKPKIGEYSGIEVSTVNEIENHFHLVLPLAYKEFLLNFGKASGNLLSSYIRVGGNAVRPRKHLRLQLIRVLVSGY